MAFRLVARIVRPKPHLLVDIALPPVKGYPDERAARSDECHTAGGMPLTFASHFRGDDGTIVVMSAATVLLHLHAHLRASHAQLWLSTDEVISVGIEEHR